MSIMWNITNTNDGSSISVIMSDGESSVIRDNHPAFNSILDKLKSTSPNDTPEVVEDFVKSQINIIKMIGNKLQKLSDRVTTDGFFIYFDGDKIDGSISKYILESYKKELKSGKEESIPVENSWRSLVAFLDKLGQNPSKIAVDGLYRFISQYGLRIMPNGDFIAFKGLRENLTSVHSGFGVVDGVTFNNANLPNNPGSVVEFPRSKVVEDGAVACAKGLHAGSFSFARSFAHGKIVAVSVNPRDVVSVPFDARDQKIRCCRYQVLLELPYDYVARPEDTSIHDIDEDYDHDDYSCYECEGEDFCFCDDDVSIFDDYNFS